MNVSFLPDPQQRADWGLIEALLQPAVERGGVQIEPSDYVFAAFDGGTLFGAATVKRTGEYEAELIHVGGTRMADWVGPMEAEITNWLRECGARSICAGGRLGWVRLARTFGWVPVGTSDRGSAMFKKDLRA